MSGVLRIALLLFTALRIQRVLLWIGAALVLIGLFLPSPIKAFSMVLGLGLAALPTLFADGLLVRYFIAPRQMRLVPHARKQALGGMLLATVALSTATTLVTWALSPGADLLRVWLRVEAGISVALLTQFVLITSVAGFTLWFVGLFAVAQSLTLPAVRAWFQGMGPGLLLAAIAISWSAFAIWLLRARTITSPNDITQYGNRALKVGRSQASAWRTFLFANPSMIGQFGGGGLAVVMIGVFWTITALTTRSAHSTAEAIAASVKPALLLGGFGGIGGFVVVRRSKLLWLRGGRDRLGVFRICEAQAWAYYGAMAASVILMLAVACFIVPSLIGSQAITLTLTLCVGVSVLYLGLMHVRGWRVMDFVGAAVVFCGWIAALTVAPFVMDQPWTLPLIVAAILGLAFVLRLVALHRWRRIDWLVCKPPAPVVRGAHAEGSR